jgi:hypothetical protein
VSPSRRAAAAIVAALGLATASISMADPAIKPRVPVGVDPGGVLVAIVGPGTDYTRPAIAARLARDGEGEIVGWDALDGDRRPFESTSPEPGAADLLAAEAPASRLAIFRTRPPAGIQPSVEIVAAATGMAAKSRAAIILMDDGLPGTGLLAAAATKFNHALFVRAAGATDEAPASALPNVVTVAASGCASPPVVQATLKAGTACPADPARAAAAIAALAARILAAAPALEAAALKQRILVRATPRSGTIPMIENPAAPEP